MPIEDQHQTFEKSNQQLPQLTPHHFSSLRFTMQMVVISLKMSFQRPIEIAERITL